MDLQGGCVCGAVRYRLTAAPLIVHACHCRDCQRLTGAAFALNMWIEKSCVEADHAALKSFLTTAGSGKP
ncbi:MAG: GFA family protein, partial [Stellaceae bacterium]